MYEKTTSHDVRFNVEKKLLSVEKYFVKSVHRYKIHEKSVTEKSMFFRQINIFLKNTVWYNG